jgi:hypothetical protein
LPEDSGLRRLVVDATALEIVEHARQGRLERNLERR